MSLETGKTRQGRCYCGRCSITAPKDAEVVAWCHCADCKRWTGAPAPAFAAFGMGSVSITGTPKDTLYESGVARQNCPDCGSPLTAVFPYLPDQIYVPLGLFDAAENLVPQVHCFAGKALSWAIHEDGLPREGGTGRDRLAGSET